MSDIVSIILSYTMNVFIRILFLNMFLNILFLIMYLCGCNLDAMPLEARREHKIPWS